MTAQCKKFIQTSFQKTKYVCVAVYGNASPMGNFVGCGLSPLLFNIYNYQVIKLWKQTKPNGTVINQKRKHGNTTFSRWPEFKIKHIGRLAKVLKDFNIKISNKTKDMAVEGKNIRSVKIVIKKTGRNGDHIDKL